MLLSFGHFRDGGADSDIVLLLLFGGKGKLGWRFGGVSIVSLQKVATCEDGILLKNKLIRLLASGLVSLPVADLQIAFHSKLEQ